MKQLLFAFLPSVECLFVHVPLYQEDGIFGSSSLWNETSHTIEELCSRLCMSLERDSLRQTPR